VCSGPVRHKNENNDYRTTEVLTKIRMELKFCLRKNGKRNRVFCLHMCNLKCAIAITKVILCFVDCASSRNSG
jgi:hypothetical protein